MTHTDAHQAPISHSSQPWIPTKPPSPPQAGQYWLWQKNQPGYAPYKNEILIRYQNALTACGVPRTDQRLFVQQVTQENGALDPLLTGGTDHGYSFGIGQWNTRPIRSKHYLQLHPESATLDWQINTLASSSCGLYKTYKGDVRRVIVHHNCPACALSNARPSACSAVDAWHKKTKSCYFDDEVNSPKHSAYFVLSSPLLQ